MKNTIVTLMAIAWSAWSPPVIAADVEARITAPRVTQAPVVDGEGRDAAWKGAKETKVVAKGVFPANASKSTEVVIRSVHTDSHVFFLVRWSDETRDDRAQKPFAWDPAKSAYVEGSEREDMFALAFEHTGPFTADMLSPEEAIWDVWHWKAARTDPQGFAMDRTHRHAAAVGGQGEVAQSQGRSAHLDRPRRRRRGHRGREAGGSRCP